MSHLITDTQPGTARAILQRRATRLMKPTPYLPGTTTQAGHPRIGTQCATARQHTQDGHLLHETQEGPAVQ